MRLRRSSVKQSEPKPVRPKPTVVSSVFDCKFRGEKTGEQKKCLVCGSRGKTIDLFQCEIFGVCTIDPWKSGQDEACCKKCDLIEKPCTFRVQPFEKQYPEQDSNLRPTD